MGQDLPPGAAVDTLLGDAAVPAPEELVHLGQTLEGATLERIVVDQAAAALLNALLLRMARGVTSHEPPVLGEGLVELVDSGS
jgi:hypothetical protein